MIRRCLAVMPTPSRADIVFGQLNGSLAYDDDHFDDADPAVTELFGL